MEQFIWRVKMLMQQNIFKKRRLARQERKRQQAEARVRRSVAVGDYLDPPSLGCFIAELKDLVVQHKRSQLRLAVGTRHS